MLRKAIDYYCHLAVKPEFWSVLSTQDSEYMSTEYAAKSEWLKNDKDDIYDPDYNDMLRVAFMFKFGRGKLSDLVSLLSGRDFATRDYKSEIADESFEKLNDGVLRFMNENNFKDFVLAIRSAGFTSSSLISSQGALNFAYNLYLMLREDNNISATDVKRYVQRWHVMSVLTGRYSGSSESVMDRDIRRITEMGFLQFYDEIVKANLSESFWEAALPQNLVTTSTRTGGWLVYVASQIKEADNTLFTNGVKVSDVIASIGDIHHIFPKDFLRKEISAPQRLYNQVANYAYLEKRINIKVGARRPGDYFSEALECAKSGAPYFGNIYGEENLLDNLSQNCIPGDIFDMEAEDYERFLNERRILMANKIKSYFFAL